MGDIMYPVEYKIQVFSGPAVSPCNIYSAQPVPSPPSYSGPDLGLERDGFEALCNHECFCNTNILLLEVSACFVVVLKEGVS